MMAVKDQVDITHYTYRVSWSAEDGEYVATCLEFPSLSWLDAGQIEALRGLELLVSDVIADMQAADEAIPKPLADRVYSGKFQVRVPPELHGRLAAAAAESNISLNRYVSDRLARS